MCLCACVWGWARVRLRLWAWGWRVFRWVPGSWVSLAPWCVGGCACVRALPRFVRAAVGLCGPAPVGVCPGSPVGPGVLRVSGVWVRGLFSLPSLVGPGVLCLRRVRVCGWPVRVLVCVCVCVCLLRVRLRLRSLGSCVFRWVPGSCVSLAG